MRLFLVVIFLAIALLPVSCSKKQTPQNIVPPVQSEAQPSEPQQDTTSRGMPDPDEISKQFQPVFFDFDKYKIRSDQVPALQNNAGILQSNPGINLTIEGHCDERGTEEYNLALGDRRANAVKEHLTSLGIPHNRLTVISYGESRPFELGHNEESWQQNRRGHSVVLKTE
jgi:peptidoglycan-associated lipoprotein